MLEADTRAAQEWKDYRWVMWALVVVVTADSVLKVFNSWHRYDHLGQFLAIVLLLALLVFPWRVMLDLKKGRRMAMEQFVGFAYLLLMMSENVFGG